MTSVSLLLCASVAFRPFDLAQGTLFEKKRDLKKQSQFSGGQNDVKSVQAMTYGDFNGLRRLKNKANFFAKYSIVLLAMGLFELYQCDPVFAGIGGRLADVG